MNTFDPCTFSTDWEHFVVDRLLRDVPEDRLLGVAGLLHAELGLPITIDKHSLEFPLGINHSFAQLWERIRQTTDRAAELLHAFEVELYPAAAHPLERYVNSAHIHVGTLRDESAGIHLSNQLLPYLPAFAALAANAPVSHGRRGEYKSYRVRYQANGDISPTTWRDPAVSQLTWGVDAGPKIELVPTLEIRITDCTSSRRLLAELAVFVAAFVQHQGAHLSPTPPDARLYREYLVNRWTTARDGLQATFHWQGGTRPAVEVLEEMLARCADELQALGATRSTLEIIPAMLARRYCQADLVLALAERYPDTYLFTSAYGKLLRHWTWFDEAVTSARPLDPRPAVSEAEVLAAHLALIGDGTYFYRTREAMAFPPALADAVLTQLLDSGWLTADFIPERGLVLTRTAKPAPHT